MICPNSKKHKDCVYYYKKDGSDFCGKYDVYMYQINFKCEY